MIRLADSPSIAAKHLFKKRSLTFLLLGTGLFLLVVASFSATQVTRNLRLDEPTTTLSKPSRELPHKQPNSQLATHSSTDIKYQSKGRVLVTGGGGNIGKTLVRRLLSTHTPVRVIDLIFHQDELESIHLEYPQARELLDVRLFDIRNTTALQQAMTPDVVGIFHLAAVSRVLWCLENELDCWDVNERGTALVLDAIDAHPRKPWIILSSSREVYGNAKEFPVAEDAERIPANVYGASKLHAEKVIEKRAQEYSSSGLFSGKSLRAIALRLSNVYGGVDDHLERLVPSIVTQALSHLPIQISGGEQNLDMVHIDDAVEAFLLAAAQLDKSGRLGSISNTRVSFDVFNVAAGESVPVQHLIDKIISLSRSHSALLTIPGDDRFPNNYVGSLVKAANELGYRPKVFMDEGLQRLITLYLAKTKSILSKRIESTCGGAAPEILDNQQIQNLNGCYGDFHVKILDGFATLRARSIGADNTKMDYQWHLLSNMVPSMVIFSVTLSEDGIPLLKVAREVGAYLDVPRPAGWLGLKASTKHQDTFMFDYVTTEDADLSGFIYQFEMDINYQEGSFNLKIPGTDKYILPPQTLHGNFTLSQMKPQECHFKSIPICCPNVPQPWPFYRQDPILNSIENQVTSTHNSFSGAVPSTLCALSSKALAKASQHLATLDDHHLTQSAPPRRGEASEWIQNGLPACKNDCSLPYVCLDTGDCQCVVSLCKQRLRFPFSSVANLPHLSYPELAPSQLANPLLSMVEKSSWLNVLRPHASRFVRASSLPKVSIVTLESSLETQRVDYLKANSDLLSLNCFSASASMELAVRENMSSADDADILFEPFYAPQTMQDTLELWTTATFEAQPQIDPRKLVVPFTHDWGACMKIGWSVWEMREEKAAIPDFLKYATAWTVMGDLNIPCYRPHQDVMIPPRTCITPKLFDAFSDLTQVRPSRDRKVLVTFEGGKSGTGYKMRQRLTCSSRPMKESSQTVLGIPDLRVHWAAPEGSYMEQLNNTIFCPLPTGTTGWATRTSDIIYAGCIPVILTETAQFPFWDMIDWSKIAVFVPSFHLERLEDVLSAIPLSEIERMQANLMLIRDALVYPLDGNHRDLLETKSPFFFAMHSTKMKRLMRWPTTPISRV